MKRLQRFQPKNRHYLLLTFLIALGTAIMLFLPFIVYHKGIFYYYGDFNVQEIPFYQMIQNSVKNGEMGWSHLTDLGSDTLSSYSFYLLGSPFFWMTMPFPNELVPYLIGPLFMLKFACAAAAAHLYIRRYVENKMFAVLGGLLYAFSGFSIYNIFFFHFHEPMIAFPLLLAAFDAFLFDRRRGLIAVAVFGACVVNYYFFTGQALFVLMYFLMLTLTRTWRFKIKEFLLLCAEVIIGFAATAFMLLPSVLGILGNPRLNELPNDWKSLAYPAEQRYWLIILSFLFPADMPATPVFTPESNCKWASVAGWLPLLSVTGVVAYLQLKKRDWLKKLIALLILFAMIPVLNSMFQLMNSSIYYARWFYMPVLMFALASVKALEDEEANWNRAIAWSAGLTVGATVLIGFMPKKTEEEPGKITWSPGVENSTLHFWVYALIAMIGLLCFALIYKKFNRRRGFAVWLIIAAMALSLGSSYYIIAAKTAGSETTAAIKSHIINARDKVEIDDLEEVRIDSFKCPDNLGMFWQVPSINCFQSSVSPSIMKFYQAVGIERSVGSRPGYSSYGLRGLLSVKYFFDDTCDNDDPEQECCFTDKSGDPKMFGFEFYKNTNGWDVYINKNYVPMGFVFPDYITEEEFERVGSYNRTEALVNAMVLTKEQMKKYSDITGYTDEGYAMLYGDTPEEFKSVTDDFKYGEEAYEKTCAVLRSRACDSFEYTKEGFTASFNNSGQDALLFFSVPYSEGFSATVNGEPVEIERATFGFMAVRVPKGKSDIVFTYETPGFKTGVVISLCALAAFAVYITLIIVFRIIRKKRIRRDSDI